MQEVPNARKRKARVEVASALTARERALLSAERQIVKRDTALAWLKRYFAEKRAGPVRLAGTREPRAAGHRERPRGRRPSPAGGCDHGAAGSAAARRSARPVGPRAWPERRPRSSAGWATPPTPRWPATRRLWSQIPLTCAKTWRTTSSWRPFEPMARMAAAEAREAEARQERRLGLGSELRQARSGVQRHDVVPSERSSCRCSPPPAAIPRCSPSARRCSASKRSARRCCASTPRRSNRSSPSKKSSRGKLARLRDSALPLAEERVRLLMASYEAGRTDLGAVLAARRERVETRAQGDRTEAALAELRARLAYLLAEHGP